MTKNAGAMNIAPVGQPDIDLDEGSPKDKKLSTADKIQFATYQKRISFVRLGQQAMKDQQFAQGSRLYLKYLATLAHKCKKTVETLDPADFASGAEKQELLLVSQVYWDLTKYYDKVPSNKSPFVVFLQQFIRFSLNTPHQVLNAEILRKHIRAKKATHVEQFREAYNQIGSQSKSCFVATMVFGEFHPDTEALREFKRDILVPSATGREFISFYYRFSPRFVTYCQGSPLAKTLVTPPLRFLLKLFLILCYKLRNEHNNHP